MWSIRKYQPALTAEQLQTEINQRTQSCIHDLRVELAGRQITVHGTVDSYVILQSVIQTLLDLQIKHGLRVVLDVQCVSSRPLEQNTHSCQEVRNVGSQSQNR